MTDEAEHLLRSELNMLKAQIDTLKRQLEDVEPRVRQMEPAVRMIEINNGNPEPISPAFGEAPIPQLWGEDPKPWAVEWEPRENGGSGSWLIYLPETGSFKENTLTPSLDSAFSTMRSSMESSTARPNTSWMVLEVSSSSASTVYLSITKPSEGTPTMTISTSAATGAINFPIAATAANHTVSQYLFGELAIGGDGGGGVTAITDEDGEKELTGVVKIVPGYKASSKFGEDPGISVVVNTEEGANEIKIEPVGNTVSPWACMRVGYDSQTRELIVYQGYAKFYKGMVKEWPSEISANRHILCTIPREYTPPSTSDITFSNKKVVIDTQYDASSYQLQKKYATVSVDHGLITKWTEDSGFTSYHQAVPETL